MISGITGSLLSEDALETVVPEALRGLLDEAGRDAARRRLRAWHVPLRKQLGPAATVRTIFDRLATPLLAQLGYRVVPGAVRDGGYCARLEAGGQARAILVVTNWGEHHAALWRQAVRQGIGHEVRWCYCLTGPSLRIVDSLRTYSRRFVEFDLEIALEQEKTFAILWGLLRAEAMVRTQPLLDTAVTLSEQHRTSVRSSLQVGVNEALMHLTHAFAKAASHRHSETHVFSESLVVIYRILFLLFAEARGLVPRWHPVYRDSYTIESLRGPVEMLPRPRGVWETLQAIARLAHRGCRIGTLSVTPFNGHLFSPGHAPLADSTQLDDGVVRQALLALTTRSWRGRRERIAYGDLGVEQLGAVYERLLDVEPVPGPIGHRPSSRKRPSLGRSERRKTTGSFYTPRSLTEYLVRRTLAPLVHDSSAAALLELRVLDPAMGSGAFLVAACRYLALAYEAAIVREGTFAPEEIGEQERAEFRRNVAQRCLYGVDINPMAVQLGRLSLWLATLSSDHPLTFLDHRLRTGNSLVGASLADVGRQPPGGSPRTRQRDLPLFADLVPDDALQHAIAVRSAIATEPGDTLEQVRAKERALDLLGRRDSQLACWKDICDLWCSGWFGDRNSRREAPATFSELVDARVGRGTLPAHITSRMLGEALDVASRERFFHWTLEFPEAFHAADGSSHAAPGFDAIVGNPPWEMLRGDRGDRDMRDAARTGTARLTDFARHSGIYGWQGAGHGNLYQLFLERVLKLVRPGGRFGMVFPNGLATDAGAATLRRALFNRTDVDTLVSLENRDGVFPIHRGLKFLLLTATNGDRTATVTCRFGVRNPETLDRLPDLGGDPEAIALTRSLLEQLSGDQLAIPDVRSRRDLDLLHTIAFNIAAIGGQDGWNLHFGRELNASDDRRYFDEDSSGMPVVEGKQISPFHVDTHSARFRIAARTAARLVDPARTFRRARLAYREVASATNRLTLIAAIVPSGTITTHTVFCLKESIDDESQLFVCGMLNSFVANYLVRLRVSTHVTAGIIDRLPVPRPLRNDAGFREIVALSRALFRTPSDRAATARLQARAARLYGLDRALFQHVLDTFPLVPRADRDAALTAFCDIVC